mgnify:CR=1 FL=1
MDLDPTFLTWIFLIGGVLLLFFEVVVPGGVALFLGLGGIVVAALRFIGLLTDPFTAVIAWALLSAGLTVALRPVALRYFGGDSITGITDENAETMGQTVTVTEPVSAEKPGRVRFRGAAWDARTVEGTLPKGAEARIVYRDNLTWVVEPVDHSDLDQELADAIGQESFEEIEDQVSSNTSSSESVDAEPSSSAPRSRSSS